MKKFAYMVFVTIFISLLLSACVRPGRSGNAPTFVITTNDQGSALGTPVPAFATDTPAPGSALSPSENLLAIINPDNISNLAGSETIQEPGAQVFTWIAGDQAIAVGAGQEVALFTTSPQLQVASIPADQPGIITASSAEARLAWAGHDQAIHVWDVTQASEVASLQVEGGEVTSLAFSPSGNLLAAATFDNNITLWNANTGELIHNWVMPAFFTNLSFSPDETRLAGIDPQSFAAHILDIGSQEVVQTLTWTDHASPVLYSAHFSPDWQRLAWVARGTVQLMDVGSGVMGLDLQHEDAVNDMAWSPDGSLIAVLTAATVDGSFVPALILWETSTGISVRVIPLQAPASQVEFSPSGKELAVLDSQGSLSLWTIIP